MSTDKKTPMIVQVEKYLGNKNNYRFNEITGYVEYWSKEGGQIKIIDDYELNSLFGEITKRKIKYPLSNLRALLKSSFAPKYNPFLDYFYNLPEWDGETDFIQQLAETVETDNNELWYFVFRKWIVAMVASLINDEIINHTMLVFSGKQGIGKTTWILNLVPASLKNYVYSGTIDPNNKDTLIYLSESMLINLDELENLNIRQLGSTKELITKNQVRIRRPYGSIYENMPRRASFAGSVNHQEFLSDTTGSRRFLCFETKSFKYEHNIPMDKVYAQAMALAVGGFKFYLDLSEIEQINQSNEKYRTISLEEELLLKNYEQVAKTEATIFLSTSEILENIFVSHPNLINNASKLRLGKVLSANRFEKTTRDNRKVYCLKKKVLNSQGYSSNVLVNQDNQASSN